MGSYLSTKDFTILLGNVVDHFDTSLYIFLAPILAPLFFPHSDQIVALIMAYSILATSIITRPIGTYIFGIIAQNHGPSLALSYSLIGVGIGTLATGLLPDYQTIGFMAPALLVALRMISGIFAAGECAIAKLYILHDKSENEAFRGSYLYQTSSILGIALASLAVTIVHYLEINNAWRLCFIFGGIATFIGFFLRKASMVIEKKATEELIKFYSPRALHTLWKHKMDLIRIAIVTSFNHITYVIPFVTMNHLIPMVTDIEIKTMMMLNSFMLVFDMLAIPFIGKITAGLNKQHIMVTASAVLTLTIIPIWYFIENSTLFYISFVRLWIVIWGIVFLCPLNLWCRDQVMGNEKYIVVGIGTALGASPIGKLSPAICLALYHTTGSYMTIAFYAASVFGLTLFVVTKRKVPSFISNSRPSSRGARSAT